MPQVSCSSFRACTKLRTRCCGSRCRLIYIWSWKRLTSSHKISRVETRCSMHLRSLGTLTCDSSQTGFTKLAQGTWSRALVASSRELKVPFILRGASAFLSPQALSKYIAYSYIQLQQSTAAIYNIRYEGCSKFFHLENVIFAKKILSPNFRELHVFLSRYMLAKIFKKNVDVWYPQIVPGVWSLVTLHSAAAALKHLRSALRCWSLLTFIGQFWHNKSTV